MWICSFGMKLIVLVNSRVYFQVQLQPFVTTHISIHYWVVSLRSLCYCCMRDRDSRERVA